MKNAIIAGLVVSLAVVAQAAVVVLPPEGVDEYRIIFTDYWGFSATNANIEWYNAQITERANYSTKLQILSIEHDLDWYCVGSTAEVDARDNISPGIAWDSESVPIYNTHGQLVANNLADLFDGSLAPASDGVDFDQWGDNVSGYSPHYEVWTGTDEWGCKITNAIWGGPLGSANVTMGISFAGDEQWLKWIGDNPVEEHYLYGISSPIPEPTTIGLLGIAGLGLFLGRNKARR